MPWSFASSRPSCFQICWVNERRKSLWWWQCPDVRLSGSSWSTGAVTMDLVRQLQRLWLDHGCRVNNFFFHHSAEMDLYPCMDYDHFHSSLLILLPEFVWFSLLGISVPQVKHSFIYWNKPACTAIWTKHISHIVLLHKWCWCSARQQLAWGVIHWYLIYSMLINFLLDFFVR